MGSPKRHSNSIRCLTLVKKTLVLPFATSTKCGRRLPSSSKSWLWPSALLDSYYPGDVGFDPLGLKPDGAEDFAVMATKELQHGRLAMLATAGLVAQELVDGKEILVHAGLAPDNFDPS